MKTWAVICCMGLALALATSMAAAQATYPGGMVSQTTSATATVVAIDRSDREVTLRGPQGNTVTIDVGPDVRNFDQIQVGDKVNVTYYESTAVYLGPKGQKPGTTSGTVVGRGPAGTKPEGYVIDTVDAVAVVKSINRSNRTVTLQGPSGDVFTIKVPSSVQAFNQLKVGDSVYARYTEALAIDVTK